jgi:putative ABC transport system permease protein
MLNSIRQTIRSLRNTPGFSIVVVATLALGIGATTAIYSVVRHVVLRPLPYPDPDRLVQIWTSMPEARIEMLALAHAEYLDYRAESRLTDEAGAYFSRPMIFTGDGEPAKISAAWTTSSLWPVLGIEAEIGRTLAEGDDQPGAEPIVILAHGLWQSRFGGDPGIVGTTIRLDGVTRTVVGVMPPSFNFPVTGADVWIPYVLDPVRRNNHHLAVLARMQEGVSFDQLQPEMDAIVDRWDRTYDHAHPLFGVLYEEQLLGQVRQPMFLLLGVVALVLLISAVNVAGLLLARGESRQQELAVRAALGSGRLDLVWRLLGESMVLALTGGVLGLVVARFGLAAILLLEPGSVPRIGEVDLDPSVLVFGIAVSILTGIIAGVIPAWRISRTDLVGVLRSGGERIASAANRQRLRSLLVIVETAMAVVLVAGAALLLRSLWQLQRVDPGLDPDHVLTAQLSLSPSDYTNAGEVQEFYDRLLDRLESLPGVRSAALVNTLPMRDMIRMILVHGSWLPEEGEPIGADVVMASSRYLETIGNPVIKGRGFTDRDRPGSARVAAVNETAAKAFFGETDPVGEQLMIIQSQPDDVGFEVVALIQDVPTTGIGTDVRPQVYLPLPLAVAEIRGVTRAVSVVLKTTGDPSRLAGSLRSTVWELDDQLAISNVETMEQVVSSSLRPQRFQAVLLGMFSALALVLAAVGLYGLLAHIVALRRRELGVRLAMGANPGRLVKLVVGQAMRLSGLGVALGIVATIGVSRVLEGLLFGVERSDAASLVSTAVVILATTVVAAWLPARRAATIDPAVMLRDE